MDNAISDIVSGNFVLVKVVVRSKSFTKKDTAATAETIANNHAASDAGSFTKNLLASARGELKAVEKAGAALRTYCYAHTTPFTPDTGSLKKGERLLPAVKSMDFFNEYGTLEAAYNTALAEFKSVYDVRRAQALVALGDMANPNEYPDSSELDKYFGAELVTSPVPSAASLPPTLPTEMLEKAAQDMADRQLASINNAVADTRERLGDELVRMTGVLQKHAGGEKTKLYASLLDNMRTVTDLLDATNVTNDPTLTGVVAEIRASLIPKGRTIDDYKNSVDLSQDAAETAQRINSTLTGNAPSAVSSLDELITNPVLTADPEPLVPDVEVPTEIDEVLAQSAELNEQFNQTGMEIELPDFDSMF